MLWSSTRAAEMFTRQGRVFPTPGELMRTSGHRHDTDLFFSACGASTCWGWTYSSEAKTSSI